MKSDSRDFSWIFAGVMFLLVIMLLTWHFRAKQSPAEQIALKAQRLELVAKIRFALAAASEAEKSAVMAVTDQDSQTYADQSRAAAATVEGYLKELQRLLDEGGMKHEKGLLNEFSRAFAEFQRIDGELLNLAVSNTNLKASALAFGPAAEAIKDMDAAFSRILARSADTKAMLLAANALTAALRIQTTLPPHIAEESDEKMDALEVSMAKEDREVRKDLNELGSLLKEEARHDLDSATSAYMRFTEIKGRIIKLSRENTNVRSLALSLNQKRKAMFACQDTLVALEQAIQMEPVAPEPVSPR